ncbi:ABC transporter permease, partial [Microbacterium sp. NPDC097977]|uniref:ABC transporter permease n=1 Tax=Microbacterium sp. NPDC097977 TaxID=3155686 RepID=UPI00331E68D4
MAFVLRRLGYYLIAFWASLTINFLLPRLMPGDPVGRMLGQMQNLTDDQVAQFRHLFGLDDRPVWQQYIQYIGDVFTGNLGLSISQFPTPVVQVIGAQLGYTILLGGTALVISFVLGNLLGIWAAWRRGGALDTIFPPLLVFTGSFPYFFIAMIALYLFAVTLKWFPIGQAFTLGTVPSFSGEFIGDLLLHLVLPAGTIVAVSIGGWMLGMRNTMIGTAAEDYITMARAKGLTERRIMYRYAARNAMLP